MHPPPPLDRPAARITRADRALAILRHTAPFAVRHETLIAAMWPECRPASTAAAITSVIHLLRRAGHSIERVPGGYRLRRGDASSGVAPS